MARPAAQRIADRARPGLAKGVARRADSYFRAFGPRIEAHVRPRLGELVDRFAKKDVTTELDQAVAVLLRSFRWDAEKRQFVAIVRPALELVGAAAADAVGAEIGVDVSFDLGAREILRDDVATRVQQIPETSRTRLVSLIAEGIDKGLSVEQIVRGVPAGRSNVAGPIPQFAGIRGLVDSWLSTGSKGFAGAGTNYASRSYLIALTETANAWNTSALATYRGAGVDFVEVFDGPDCGWSSHRDPDLAHGSIRTNAEAKAHPIAHPRCQRAFGAAVNATGARSSPFAGRKPTEVPGASPGVAAIRTDFREAADAIAARAAEAEAEVSAALDRIRREIGGEFQGFDFRLKQPIRIAEKAQADADALGLSVEEASSGINDALRYTLNLSDDRYADGIVDAVEKLAGDGIRLATKADGTARIKNFWLGDGYQGVNAIFETASGVRFELQFGTAAQAATKEISHQLYEAMRVLAPGNPRIAEIEREIVELWAPIHAAAPPGVGDLLARLGL